MPAQDNRFLVMDDEGWLVILPEEYRGEVKSKQHSVLDGHEPLTNELIGDYGWWPLFGANRLTPATIQYKSTSSILGVRTLTMCLHFLDKPTPLVDRLPDLVDEIEYGLATSIPACDGA